MSRSGNELIREVLDIVVIVLALVAFSGMGKAQPAPSDEPQLLPLVWRETERPEPVMLLAAQKQKYGLVVPDRCWKSVLILTDSQGRPKCEPVTALNYVENSGHVQLQERRMWDGTYTRFREEVDLRNCQVQLEFSCTEAAPVVERAGRQPRPLIIKEPDVTCLPVNKPWKMKHTVTTEFIP